MSTCRQCLTLQLAGLHGSRCVKCEKLNERGEHPVFCAACEAEGRDRVVGFSPVPGSHRLCKEHADRLRRENGLAVGGPCAPCADPDTSPGNMMPPSDGRQPSNLRDNPVEAPAGASGTGEDSSLSPGDPGRGPVGTSQPPTTIRALGSPARASVAAGADASRTTHKPFTQRPVSREAGASRAGATSHGGPR